jgi:hypothetical protein
MVGGARRPALGVKRTTDRQGVRRCAAAENQRVFAVDQFTRAHVQTLTRGDHGVLAHTCDGFRIVGEFVRTDREAISKEATRSLVRNCLGVDADVCAIHQSPVREIALDGDS